MINFALHTYKYAKQINIYRICKNTIASFNALVMARLFSIFVWFLLNMQAIGLNTKSNMIPTDFSYSLRTTVHF